MSALTDTLIDGLNTLLASGSQIPASRLRAYEALVVGAIGTLEARARGNQIIYTSGVPGNSLGIEGDLGVNKLTGDFYQFVNGQFVLLFNGTGKVGTFTPIAQNAFGTHPAFTNQDALNDYLLGNTGSGGTTPTPAKPTITGFLPMSGAQGSTVVLTGTSFTGATLVSINLATVASFTVDSATQITAVLSGSQVTGRVRVTTAAGTGVSTSDFTVTVAGAKPRMLQAEDDSEGAFYYKADGTWIMPKPTFLGTPQSQQFIGKLAAICTNPGVKFGNNAYPGFNLVDATTDGPAPSLVPYGLNVNVVDNCRQVINANKASFDIDLAVGFLENAFAVSTLAEVKNLFDLYNTQRLGMGAKRIFWRTGVNRTGTNSATVDGSNYWDNLVALRAYMRSQAAASNGIIIILNDADAPNISVVGFPQNADYCNQNDGGGYVHFTEYGNVEQANHFRGTLINYGYTFSGLAVPIGNGGMPVGSFTDTYTTTAADYTTACGSGTGAPVTATATSNASQSAANLAAKNAAIAGIVCNVGPASRFLAYYNANTAGNTANEWFDESGNNNHVFPVGGTMQLVTDSGTGVKSYQTDSARKARWQVPALSTVDSDYTVYLLIRWRTPTLGYNVGYPFDSLLPRSVLGVNISTGGVYSGGNWSGPTIVAPADQYSLLTWRLNSTAGVITRRNGVALASGGVWTKAKLNGSLRLGGPATDDNDSDAVFPGEMVAFAISAGNDTDAQVTAQEGRFASLVGMTL